MKTPTVSSCLCLLTLLTLSSTRVLAQSRTITQVAFFVNGLPIIGTVALTPATVAGLPAGTTVATRRALSWKWPGRHTLTVTALQDDNSTVTATGDFEVVSIEPGAHRAKNVIIMIGTPRPRAFGPRASPW